MQHCRCTIILYTFTRYTALLDQTMGVFRGFYGFKPQNKIFTFRKPKLLENRTKFNAKLSEVNPQDCFSGYASGSATERQ